MLTVTATGLRIAVRVQPRSARNRVVGRHGDALKLQVTAPPVEGAANQAVIELLAEWIGVPRRQVRIVQGETARDKVVEVASSDPAALAERVRTAATHVDKVGGPS